MKRSRKEEQEKQDEGKRRRTSPPAVKIHPALLGGNVQVPATVQANKNPKVEKPVVNPYLAERSGGRRSRPLKMNPAGKFIKRAEEARQTAREEELEQLIADTTSTQQGLLIDLELVPESVLYTSPPPLIEWWDAGLIINADYDNITGINFYLSLGIISVLTF